MVADPPAADGRSSSAGQQLVEYLGVLRRRWMLVVAITALVLGTAVALSVTSTKQYDATAKLLLSEDEPINTLLDPTGGGRAADPEREVNTNVELIKLETVAERVQRRLRLRISTTDLLDRITVETRSTSDVVSLTARDPQPRRASQIANAFAEEYVVFRRAAARTNLQEAARLAESQLNALDPEDRASDQGRQLSARLRELQIAAALQTGGVEVVRRASVPTEPSRPRPLLSAALGLILGLALAVAVAFLAEFLDRRLKDETAIENLFGLSILAGIPRLARRGRPDDTPQREAYGMLAANVRLSHRDRDSTVVMITSPGPGDGKTSVTLGLARALAVLGQQVIAIEADLRRPAFGRYSDVPGTSGLSSVLVGTSRLTDELVWMDAETMSPVTSERLQSGTPLAMLRAGSPVASAQAALAHPAMAEVVQQARSLADVVLIDTPPVGSVNDPITLAPLADEVILVIRLNKTTKDAGRRTLRALRNIDARLAGLVLTDVPASEDYAYYGVERADEEVPAGPRA